MEPDLTAQDAISQRELVSRQADDPHAEAPLVLSSRSQEDAKESETKYTIDNVPEKGAGIIKTNQKGIGEKYKVRPVTRVKITTIVAIKIFSIPVNKFSCHRRVHDVLICMLFGRNKKWQHKIGSSSLKLQLFRLGKARKMPRTVAGLIKLS